MRTSQVPSYRLYRQGADESGDFWLHGETLSQRSQLHNWEIALHRHDGLFQVFVLLKGEGELLEGAGRRPFSAPCAIYIAPAAVHGFQYAQGSDGLVFTVLEDRLATIRAADPAIAEFLAQSRIVPLSHDGREEQLLVDLAARVHDEVHGVRPGANLLLEAMVTELLLRLARLQVNRGHADPSPTSRERDRRRMHQLISLLSTHCREHRPVSFYAEKLGLSVPHLNRIARNEAKASVQELAAIQLVRFAKRELVFTSASISSIAYALGFQDPAYFNRFFKRETGMTPGQYREMERTKLARSGQVVSEPAE